MFPVNLQNPAFLVQPYLKNIGLVSIICNKSKNRSTFFIILCYLYCFQHKIIEFWNLFRPAMIEIKGKIVSLEIIENKFVCNLNACKGACCIEGIEGAPLEKNELEDLSRNKEHILDYLDEEGKSIIKERLASSKEINKWFTPLKKDGACAYSTKDEMGILHCGIEQSYKDKKSTFLKPISCHLYPIRIFKNIETGWEALNYDRWDICSPACAHGEMLKIPVYRFLKSALIRKYGEAFYNELDEVATQWTNRSE